jgi:hypothetical protein
LVLRMRMLRDHVAMCEVGRHARHLAEKPAIRGMKYALALVRHFLSRYRENLPSASAIPDERLAPKQAAVGQAFLPVSLSE